MQANDVKVINAIRTLSAMLGSEEGLKPIVFTKAD